MSVSRSVRARVTYDGDFEVHISCFTHSSQHNATSRHAKNNYVVNALRLQDCAEIGRAERAESSLRENYLVVAGFEFVDYRCTRSAINNTVGALNTGEGLKDVRSGQKFRKIFFVYLE